MVKMTYASVGVAWIGRHWAWPPQYRRLREKGMFIPFWVVGCFGGDAVFCRVLLVFGEGVRGVEFLCECVRYGCLPFFWVVWLGSCFSGMRFMCGQESLMFVCGGVQTVGWWSFG